MIFAFGTQPLENAASKPEYHGVNRGVQSLFLKSFKEFEAPKGPDIKTWDVTVSGVSKQSLCVDFIRFKFICMD